MKYPFIELTGTDDEKILINAIHIGWIEPNKSGSKIIFNISNYSLPKKVKESYEVVRSLLLNPDFSR
jgi:hypothetical protein